MPETIEELNNLQNQLANAQIEGENAFHLHFERAYKRALMRSGAGSTLGHLKMCGLFLCGPKYAKLTDYAHLTLSKFRRMVMEELIMNTKKTEEEIAEIFDINIVKQDKNNIKWNKKESYTRSKIYLEMEKALLEETKIVKLEVKQSAEKKEHKKSEAQKYHQTPQQLRPRPLP